MENTIEINGREFVVTVIELSADLVAKGRKVYGLTGKKGAQYGAVQYINRPDLFHIINLYAATVSPFAGVVLTDKNGKLEVVRRATIKRNVYGGEVVAEYRA